MPIDPARPKFFYGYVIVLSSLAMSLMMWGSRFSFGVFFPPVLEEFGWSRAATSGGFSLTWVLTGLLSIGVGRLNDRFGPRIIMTIAGGLLGLGYVLMSALTSIWQLYLFFGIISLGMSAALVPTLSTVARWFARLRGLMTGIVLSGGGIALVVLVPAANRIILDYGWRTAYAMLGITAAAVIVTAAQLLKKSPSGLGLLPYGHRESETPVLTGRVEGLHAKEAFRTRQLWLIGLVYFCTYFIFNVITVHMIIFAEGQGISSSRAVSIMVFVGITGIAGRVIMGYVADAIGNRKAMAVGSGLMLLSLLWLLTARQLWMLQLFALAFGFGHGGLATMESTITAKMFGLRSHGILLGTVFFCDTMGGATGPFLAGFIFDQTRSYHLAFLLCAALGLMNVIAILMLRPLPKRPGRSS